MQNTPNQLPNAFTVDLEDWFQGLTSTNPQIERWPEFESRVEPATDNLLALLRNQHVKATFFVLGYVADRHPALIERIVDGGHEIGVHGYYHRFVYRLTPDEFANELELSIAAVERITGRQPLGHRAPYFSVNGTTPWAFSIMQAHGLIHTTAASSPHATCCTAIQAPLGTPIVWTGQNSSSFPPPPLGQSVSHGPLRVDFIRERCRIQSPAGP